MSVGPRVAVVIPARDEEATIGPLLDSLLAQSRPPDEIIVVDAGSTDATAARVESRAGGRVPVQLIRGERSYPGTARNQGVRSTDTDFVAFTDAGIQVDPKWLERLVERIINDPEVDVVYGSYEPVLESYFQECAALAYIPAPTAGPDGPIRGPSLASSLVRRSVWERVGGFPPFRAAEDLIFMDAVERSGARIAFAPGAVVHWQIPAGWRTTLRRFTLYSKHNLVAGRGRYWHMGVLRQYIAVLLSLAIAIYYPIFLLAPPLWLLARVGRTLWRKRRAFPISRPLNPLRWIMVAAILLLLDFATLAGSCAYALEKLRIRRRATFALGDFENRDPS